MAADDPFVHWERNFISHLVRLREAKGLTQTDVAKAVAGEGLKFHQQTIQRIEAGERPVRLDEAFLIARFFDVSVETMTGLSFASHDDLIFTVDRLRIAAGTLAENLREELADWADDVDAFVATVMELEPQQDDDRPIVRWTLEWASRFNEITRGLLETANEAGWNAGESEEEREMTVGSFDAVRAWTKSGVYKATPELSIEPNKLAAWLREHRG